MDLVAEDLDLEQTIVNTPFETIETGQAMATGKCDIAAAGMTITEERDKVIDFSDPYFNATQALLVKKGAGYDSLESLDGKTLGVQVGTTGQDYADENAPERRRAQGVRGPRPAARGGQERQHRRRASTTTPCCSTTPSRTPTPR